MRFRKLSPKLGSHQRKGGGKNKHVLKGRLKILGNPETKRTGLGQER